MRNTGLSGNPAVQGAIRRRRRTLLVLVALDIVLLAIAASLRIEAAPRGEADVLGFSLHLEPLRWRTAMVMGTLMLVQLWLGGRAVKAALRRREVVSIYPTDESEGATFNGTGVDDVVKMVLDVASASGIRKVSRIYLVPVPVPNAFTARVLGLGNVVALHSNLFDFLPRDGIRAVVAHEVAHIRQSDSIVRQVTTAPGAFAATIFSLAILQSAVGVLRAEGFLQLFERLFFLGMAVGATLFIVNIVTRLAVLAARESEYIADAHAGSICGWETTANMLLLLGERTEALSVLMEVFSEMVQREGDELRGFTRQELERFLTRFPPWELSDEVARAVAPKLFVQDRLEILRDRYRVELTDEEIETLSVRAADSMAGEGGTDGEPVARSTREEHGLAHWRTFDADRSGHLDDGELAELVESLSADSGRMLFRQFLSPESRREDHPPVRERILFLHEVFRGVEADRPHRPQANPAAPEPDGGND